MLFFFLCCYPKVVTLFPHFIHYYGYCVCSLSCLFNLFLLTKDYIFSPHKRLHLPYCTPSCIHERYEWQFLLVVTVKNWMMFECRNFELISISLSTIRSITCCSLLLIFMALMATSDPVQFPFLVRLAFILCIMNRNHISEIN